MSNRKGLAGFGQVAGESKPEETSTQENETSTDVNTNVGAGPTMPDISEFYTKAKAVEKKQVSIYLDTDVIEAFNEFGKQNGKGAKSDIVNNFLKKVFNIRQGG